MCFSVNFVKFLRTPFLQNTPGRLFLEIALHLFHECIETQTFLRKLPSFCNYNFFFPLSFSFFFCINANIGNKLLTNHLFLIFKMYVYFSRDTFILNFTVLKAKIIKVREIKGEIAKNNSRTTQQFHKTNGMLSNIYYLFKIT